jgi:hypothetical protein
MGVPREAIPQAGNNAFFGLPGKVPGRLNSPFTEQILSCDAMRFGDCGKFHAPMFGAE